VPERPAQLPRDEPEADEADAPEVRKHLLADRAGDGASQQPVIGDEEWRLQCAKTRHAVALPCPRGEVSDLDLAASQVADEPHSLFGSALRYGSVDWTSRTRLSEPCWMK
jgi:hypothetical protein